MTSKEQIAWEAAKAWLIKFHNDERPWEEVSAADLLTLLHEAEINNSISEPSPIANENDQTTFLEVDAPEGSFRWVIPSNLVDEVLEMLRLKLGDPPTYT